MYDGHLPASGIQRHSAGELFPCFIVVYGNGEARWVNPEKRMASGRLSTHREAMSSAEAAKWLGYALGGTGAILPGAIPDLLSRRMT